MSNRVMALTVVLDKGMSDDMAEKVRDAIRLLVGVVNVSEHKENAGQHVAEQRVRMELTQKIYGALS